METPRLVRLGGAKGDRSQKEPICSPQTGCCSPNVFGSVNELGSTLVQLQLLNHSRVGFSEAAVTKELNKAKQKSPQLY